MTTIFKSLTTAVVVFFLASQMGFSQGKESSKTEDSIRHTILMLFDGMRKSDTNMIKSAFHDRAILQTIMSTNEGMRVINSPLAGLIKSVAKSNDVVYDERIQFETIKVDGDMASVWTPYEFYVGSQFSHCGVNSFQLVRLQGVWKIQYLIDTRRKEPCAVKQ